MLVTAVRAKAIVRSSVLCSLDELCKTFLLKDTMLKILRKTSTKSGGLPFFSKGKACGVIGKELRAQNYNSAAKDRCPSKHVTFLRCLAEVARAEGDYEKEQERCQLLQGTFLLRTPPCARMSGFRAAATGPKGIRTLPLSQSCFPD